MTDNPYEAPAESNPSPQKPVKGLWLVISLLAVISVMLFAVISVVLLNWLLWT